MKVTSTDSRGNHYTLDPITRRYVQENPPTWALPDSDGWTPVVRTRTVLPGDTVGNRCIAMNRTVDAFAKVITSTSFVSICMTTRARVIRRSCVPSVNTTESPLNRANTAPTFANGIFELTGGHGRSVVRAGC